MKLQLDQMNNVADWTFSSAAGVNSDWPFYRSSFIEGQMNVTFQAAGFMSRSFSPAVDLAGYDAIGFWVSFIRAAGTLKVTITNGASSQVFRISVTRGNHQYSVPVLYPAITAIKFESDDLFRVVLTDLVAFKDRYPTDILDGMVEFIENNLPSGITPQIGTTMATAAGRQTIVLEGDEEYLAKFALFTIGDATHQVEALNILDSGLFEIVLGQAFDGAETVAAYPAGTPIYLAIPVVANPAHIEGITPAISVESRLELEDSRAMSFRSEDILCIDNGDETVYVLERLGTQKFKITVHGLYRSLETMTMIGEIFNRAFAYAQRFWINGRQLFFESTGSQSIDLPESGGETGEIQYQCEVTLEDYKWPPRTIATNLQGVLQVEPVAAV